MRAMGRRLIIDWLPEANRNRIEQLDYIAEDSPLAAADQDDEIERQINMLHEQPKLGRLGRIKGTRELVISNTPFIAVYRLKVPSASRCCECSTGHSAGRQRGDEAGIARMRTGSEAWLAHGLSLLTLDADLSALLVSASGRPANE